MRSEGALLCGWLAFAMAAPCHAQAAAEKPAAEPATVDMDAVVVTGTQPGPGLWKVSKGDHVLWILGTVAPLPSGIEWKSDEVRGALERADQVLGQPGVVVDADVGIFRGLLLLPSAMKAMKNPDGRTLREILPAETYARWTAAKQRYIGRDDGIEKKRPFIAAQQLYAKVVEKSGLGGKVVSSVVGEVLKRRRMEYTPTTLKITMADPKAAIADFRKEQLDGRELACMGEVLDTVEHDIPRMVVRANAWSVGDLQALRSLRPAEQDDCWSAWADTEAMRKRGITDIKARMKAKWLEVASAALDKNASTFALLPVESLLREDGVLADLAAKGYVVESPE